MAIEHYYKWYHKGAQGTPKILDSSVVFDFPNTDIEHIYPQRSEIKNSDIEEIKHSLGNLTLLGPGDNKEASNKPFKEKRPTFDESAFRINNPLSEKEEWSKESIETREKKLVDMALEIYSF